jgi:hypothetical protein
MSFRSGTDDMGKNPSPTGSQRFPRSCLLGPDVFQSPKQVMSISALSSSQTRVGEAGTTSHFLVLLYLISQSPSSSIVVPETAARDGTGHVILCLVSGQKSSWKMMEQEDSGEEEANGAGTHLRYAEDSWCLPGCQFGH